MDDVKPITIGQKRPKKLEKDNRDYSPDRAETITKTKCPNVDMGKSPSRPVSFAKPGTEASGGPGQYDAGKKFMDDVKPITIG